MRVKSGKALVYALAAAGACTGSPGDGRVPDAGSRSFARLAVTVTLPHDGAPTLGASARLLRYHGVDIESAQVLAGTPGAARDLGSGGSCALVDDEALLDDALATSPPDAAVQMLDAGEMLIHIGGQTVKLSPRYVPEILPFVSGVMYDAEAQAVDGVEGRDDAYVAAFGGQQIGRFSAPADVPADPRLLTLNGGDVDAHPPLGGGLTVTWAGEQGRNNVAFVVAGDHGPALRCTAPDVGRFTIPADAMARFLDVVRDGGLTLSVERTRRTAFSTKGLDAAEIEVTVRDVATLR